MTVAPGIESRTSGPSQFQTCWSNIEGQNTPCFETDVAIVGCAVGARFYTEYRAGNDWQSVSECLYESSGVFSVRVDATSCVSQEFLSFK